MNEAADKWIQRALVATLLALAAGLVVLGVALYVPSPHAQPAAAMRIR